MTSNIVKIQENGTYVGFEEGVGFVYEMNNKFYAFTKDGFKELS